MEYLPNQIFPCPMIDGARRNVHLILKSLKHYTPVLPKSTCVRNNMYNVLDFFQGDAIPENSIFVNEKKRKSALKIKISRSKQLVQQLAFANIVNNAVIIIIKKKL